MNVSSQSRPRPAADAYPPSLPSSSRALMSTLSPEVPFPPAWREKLSRDFGAGYFLSKDSSKRSPESHQFAIEVKPALGKSIRLWEKRAGLTDPSLPFLAFFCAYLHRLNHERDVRVGVALDIPKDRVGGQAGPNPMPLHLHIEENETLQSLTLKISEELDWARNHAFDFPPNPVHEKLYDAVYRHEELPPDSAGEGAGGFPVPVSFHETLALTVGRSEAGGYALRLSLNAEAFEPGHRSRSLDHLLNLVEWLCQHPSRSLNQAPLLSPPEKGRILEHFNSTYYPYPRDPGLHSIIEAQVRKTPSATALVFEGRRLTYAQMNARANRLAHRLIAEGITLDACVGVSCDRSLEMPLALLAILKAGGAYVPLDPSYPQSRLEVMVQDARISLVLADADKFHLFPPGTRCIALDSIWKEESAEYIHNPEVEVDPEHLAYVIYTSGSTGQPKGAMNTHGAICNRLRWMQREMELQESDRVLQKTPYSFDVSVWEFFWPLMYGAALLIAKPEGHRDGQYLARLVKEEGVTVLHFVPSMLSLFLEEIQAGSLPGLRTVVCSGEALSHDLMQRFFRKIRARLYNLYGPTEAAVDVTYWECRPDYPRSVVPIGRPIDNVQMYVLDRHLNPVPIGVPGEIYIGGAGVGKGYVNRAELTRERFLPSPFQGGHGLLYKTSDLGRFLEDGNLEYLGRLDFQVKLRGFRIELAEVQHVLLQHAAIREAVVVVREDQKDDKRLVAYVVASSQEPLDKRSILAFLESKLPQHMVPYALVRMASLPLSPNGKADIKALPPPSSEGNGMEERHILPPRDEIEAALVKIWERTLEVHPISIADNFFQLGGYSLLAISMLADINQAFGTEISVGSLLSGRARLDQMAEAIRSARSLSQG